MKKKQEEIFVGLGSHLNIQTSQLVILNETLTVMEKNTPIELNVKVEADFSTVPEKYHETFFNIMSSRYHNKVSFSNNPFSKCLPQSDKKWWEFWKAKY
jgi:hypothetical protein